MTVKIDELFSSEQPIEAVVHLVSGEVLHWPLSSNEAIRYDVPLMVRKVITAEVPVKVEDEDAPDIPGDARRKKTKGMKMETQVIRVLEMVPWPQVKRLVYIFVVVAGEEKAPDQIVQ